MPLYKSGDKGHHDFENEKKKKEVFCPSCGKGFPYTNASDSVCKIVDNKRVCVVTYHCSSCEYRWDVEE